LRLGGDLRRHLKVRHRVDADGAVRLLAERLRLLLQLVVRGGNEMVPGKHRDLALLRVRGRLAEREPGRHPRGRSGALLQEVPT
jgi:hypothetical protein